ncbi:response regulator transcription factor [Lachnoanaerobaculum umeaense]|jgi:two component transcriptional regulator, araC family|uniref:Stage 0 sporulation protein A homolog n=1 Tax=Lachnoanaerobaculum umeaense TaxID=617123 RepID=A0A385PZT2_9FIRM|nr:response regulator [Lachnoanaerobaculum umeaense]AYA99446.1 response regulator [Lachnoanaerobaculum umeaense]PZW99548.1 two-component system response regulator YesN [Lachnoanaerobaculum umeaense]
MVKIFLVEDEKFVREGIKNEIDWKSYGFDFVGEAADGELALPLIEMSRPDILITDIKMPFMDGLELGRIVKEKFPETVIIFLSGYDDFDYAQKAIHIGASEYLLKPISKEKLLSVLKKIKTVIISKSNNTVENIKIEDIEIDIKKFDTSGFNKGKLKEFVISGNSLDIESFVDVYMNTLGSQLKSLIFRQYIIMDAFIELNNIFDNNVTEKEIFGNKFGSMEAFDLAVTDIYTVKDYLLKILLYTVDKREQLAGKNYSFLLNKAKDFVEKNYMNCDISLNNVAEYIGLSPTYFSTIFKQELGINFIDYLTKTRINEAKILLRSTDKRISDIAMEVGYRDQHYFSSSFKKYQGDTPKAYRENKNEK